MSKLKMSEDKLKQEMKIKKIIWKCNDSTNCYAFALGLDIPEERILRHAYQLGVIGATIRNIPLKHLKYMTYEERLYLDMNALKIPCLKTSQDINPYVDEYGKYYYLSWIISLYENDYDFHFLRKSENGIWYHKRGYLKFPTNVDTKGHIITDLDNCSIDNYHYIGSYKLECKVKKENNIRSR